MHAERLICCPAKNKTTKTKKEKKKQKGSQDETGLRSETGEGIRIGGRGGDEVSDDDEQQVQEASCNAMTMTADALEATKNKKKYFCHQTIASVVLSLFQQEH